MLKYLRILPLLGALCLAACSDKTEDGPGPGPGTDPDPAPSGFGIAVSGETTWTADIVWTPGSADQTYIAMVIDKATFDKSPSDEAYIASDIAYFKALAEYFETDFETVLAQYMASGPETQHITGLRNNTDYYAYAFGVKPDGTVTTGLSKIPFKTLAVQPVECSFSFATIQLDNTSVRAYVTPDNEACSFFWDCVTRADYDKFGGDDKAIATNIDLIERAVEIFQMAGQDKTFADFLDSGISYGQFNELANDTEYVLFAFGVDPSGVATTPLMKESFRTKPFVPSSMTFRTELLTSAFNGARIAFTPSTDTETYFTDCIDYETYSKAANDEEFMLSIVSQAGASMSSFLTRGYHIVDATQMLRSNTRYLAYAFGFSNAITTGMAKLDFTTPAMPTGGSATVEIAPVIEDGNTYYDRDEVVYAAYKDKAVVRNVLSPSSDAGHWYAAAFKADISGYDDLLIAEMLQTNGHTDKKEIGVLADWGARIPVAAVATDAQGRAGAVLRITVKADRSAVAPTAARTPAPLCAPLGDIAAQSGMKTISAAKVTTVPGKKLRLHPAPTNPGIPHPGPLHSRVAF